MQGFTIRWLITFALVVLLLPACSDSADEGAATTVPTATTAAQETTIPTVEVTGESDCVIDSDGTWSGPALPESGLPGSAQRDYVLNCTATSSDPRAAVEWVNTVDCDFTVNGEQTVGDCLGTATGTNDEGTWEGTFAGTTTWSGTSPAHLHVFEQTATGSGGYAGLTYVTTIEGSDFPWSLTGRIETTP
ncbi:MAG: hypothetical protein WCC01_09800 [Acidimicrobiia bacterium]